MALPQYGGPEDVLRVVEYLKPKPTGASISDAKKALGSAVLDARKVSAIAAWNIIDVTGDRLTLTLPGRDLARDPSRAAEVFANVIRANRAYMGALEWAYHQQHSLIESPDLGAYWHEHFSDLLGADSDAAIGRACAAFFRLAQGAELGVYVVGRNGKPTRLELDRTRLHALINGEPEVTTSLGSEGDNVRKPMFPDDTPSETGTQPEVSETVQSMSAPRDPLKVFISHGKNMELVEQVATILQLADIPYEIAVEEETTAIPVPEKVLAAMRRCSAGIIIVSPDGDVHVGANENVLIETGAAFVLYDQQVVLVWDKRVAVPSNLQGLYRCEIEGHELGWSAGVKLMKAIRSFRPPMAS